MKAFFKLLCIWEMKYNLSVSSYRLHKNKYFIKSEQTYENKYRNFNYNNNSYCSNHCLTD